MATTAASLFASLRSLTLDLAGVRWSETELLRWLNEGQVVAVNNKPTANVVNGPITLVAGIRQGLPAGGVFLLDITHNTDGSAITIVSRKDMDSGFPSWPSVTATAAVEHYMVDTDDPKTFLVYPPNTGGGTIQGRYAVSPATIVAAGDPITLADEYAPILLDYLLHRAYQKESKNSQRQAKSQDALTSFLRALGVSIRRDFVYIPRRTGEADGPSPV